MAKPLKREIAEPAAASMAFRTVLGDDSWAAGSAWVVRRNPTTVREQVVPQTERERVTGGGRRLIEQFNAAKLELGTEPEELTTPEARSLCRLMLAAERSYRAAARLAKRTPGAVQFLPDRLLGLKRTAAASKSAEGRQVELAGREARVREALTTQPDWSDQRVANKIGIPRSTVQRIRKLLTSKA